MKNAADIEPRSERGRLLKGYDLKEIDSPDKSSWWHVRYMERIRATMTVAMKDCSSQGLLLEIGASQANMSLLLAEAGHRTVALDNSEQSLQYALQKWEHGPLSVLTGDAQRLPLGDATVDVVMLPEVIEHLPDPLQALIEARRVVKPTGRIVLTTPNAWYVGENLPDYAEDQRPATDLTGPEGAHHLYAFSHRSLCKLAGRAGLDTLSADYVGSVVHSKYLRWLYRCFPTGLVLPLSRLLNLLPLLRGKLSQTCLMVFVPQRTPSADNQKP